MILYVVYTCPKRVNMLCCVFVFYIAMKNMISLLATSSNSCSLRAFLFSYLKKKTLLYIFVMRL